MKVGTHQDHGCRQAGASFITRKNGSWYVSNVSIIFDCSMLLYLLFWTILGFIFHFYIIFGTSLLTGGPTRIAVFLPISVYRRKGISNGVQTEWNLRERSFWNKRNPVDLEWTSSNRGGGHEGARRAPRIMGPSSVHRPTSSSYIYIHVPRKYPGTPWKIIYTTATFCIHEIPSWSRHRCSAGGGIHHGGPLHQLQGLFDKLWVVYYRPSGP